MSGRPVSRKTGPQFASTFSTSENSAQTTYAFQRQDSNFRFPAQRTSSAQQNQQQQPNQRYRQANQPAQAANKRPGQTSKQYSSSFGGSTAPGSNIMDRPRVEMVRQQKPQLSLAQMSNFIRAQPGGRAFMDESEQRNGGPINFNQTLSFAGQNMGKGGHLPPELAQMAIPFKPNPQARRAAQHREEAWQQVPMKRNQSRKQALESVHSRQIEEILQQEKRELTHQTVQRNTVQEAEQIIGSIGIPFKPKQNRQQAQRAQPQQRQFVDEQQQQQQTFQGNQEQWSDQTWQQPPQPRKPQQMSANERVMRMQQQQQQQQDQGSDEIDSPVPAAPASVQPRNAPPAVHLVRQQHPLAAVPQKNAQSLDAMIESLGRQKVMQTAFTENGAENLHRPVEDAESNKSIFSEAIEEISETVKRSGQSKDAVFHQFPVTKASAAKAGV